MLCIYVCITESSGRDPDPNDILSDGDRGNQKIFADVFHRRIESLDGRCDQRYEKWAKFQMEWRKVSRESIRQIQFPYAYREGQKELAMSVYRTILRKKKLFIQAPTGIGKTMATVFPAVKAVGEGLGDKLFYLTAKTITRTVAEQAFQTLKKQKAAL